MDYRYAVSVLSLILWAVLTIFWCIEKYSHLVDNHRREEIHIHSVELAIFAILFIISSICFILYPFIYNGTSNVSYGINTLAIFTATLLLLYPFAELLTEYRYKKRYTIIIGS